LTSRSTIQKTSPTALSPKRLTHRHGSQPRGSSAYLGLIEYGWYRKLLFHQSGCTLAPFEFEWKIVRVAATWLLCKIYVVGIPRGALEIVFSIWQGSELRHRKGLDRFLKLFGWFQATDPRDKVFAVLGLLSPGERGTNGNVPPDGILFTFSLTLYGISLAG
jgi:hypothetical protein